MPDSWISRSYADVWLPAILACATSAALAYWVLLTGHPHEDAYILYIYAEELANGHGITYFDGGPPVEGATDFLWMLALAALNRVGLDVAIAAGLLNALGLGALTAIGSWLGRDPQRPAPSLWVGMGLATFVVLSPMAMASYGGFSTGLFCAATGLCAAMLYRQRASVMPLVPVVGLLLGLLRPDGVVIGVASTVAAAFIVYRTPYRGRFVGACLASAALGVAYFAWRAHYFGEWLPLPLYVKGLTGAWLPGFGTNVGWAIRAVPLAALALLGLWLAPETRRGALLAAVGPGALLVFLLFGENTQNFAYRFQAPATALLALGAALAALRIGSSSMPIKMAALAAVGVVGIQCIDKLLDARRDFQDDAYINYFPALLAPYVPDDAIIALTEAGRLAYWAPGRTYDVVGLNTAQTARHGPSVAYLHQLQPDLLFAHTAGTLDPSGCGGPVVCRLSIDELLARRTELASTGSPSRVVQAPIVMVQYLSEADGHDVLLVRYGGVEGYYHLYAVKRGGRIDVDQVVDALERSFAPKARLSYLGIKALSSRAHPLR